MDDICESGDHHAWCQFHVRDMTECVKILRAKLAAAELQLEVSEKSRQEWIDEVHSLTERFADAEQRERRLLRALVAYLDHCGCVCAACAIHVEASNAADVSDSALNKS